MTQPPKNLDHSPKHRPSQILDMEDYLSTSCGDAISHYIHVYPITSIYIQWYPIISVYIAVTPIKINETRFNQVFDP